jgi:hypothetical protein
VAATVPLLGSALPMLLVVSLALRGMKLLMSIMAPAMSAAFSAFILSRGSRLAGQEAQTDFDPVDDEIADAHIVKGYVFV